MHFDLSDSAHRLYELGFHMFVLMLDYIKSKV